MKQAENETLATTEDMIDAWRENMKLRGQAVASYREDYDRRNDLYVSSPSFDQYLALSAYVDSLGLSPPAYISEKDMIAAYAGTFGTLYPDIDPDRLQSVLDDHLAAMARAYEAELDQALGGMQL